MPKPALIAFSVSAFLLPLIVVFAMKAGSGSDVDPNRPKGKLIYFYSNY